MVVTPLKNILSSRLKQTGIDLYITAEAVDHLARLGYDPQYGARPVRRILQRDVVNVLSKKLLAESINREIPMVVDYNNGKLVFENQNKNGI